MRQYFDWLSYPWGVLSCIHYNSNEYNWGKQTTRAELANFPHRAIHRTAYCIVVVVPVVNRARWFRLFVVDSFGELSDCTGYRKNHFGLNGFGVGGLLYPPRTLPMWQNFSQRAEKQVFWFSTAYIWSDACHIHPNFLSYQEKHFGEDRSGRG